MNRSVTLLALLGLATTSLVWLFCWEKGNARIGEHSPWTSREASAQPTSGPEETNGLSASPGPAALIPSPSLSEERKALGTPTALTDRGAFLRVVEEDGEGFRGELELRFVFVAPPRAASEEHQDEAGVKFHLQTTSQAGLLDLSAALGRVAEANSCEILLWPQDQAELRLQPSSIRAKDLGQVPA